MDTVGMDMQSLFVSSTFKDMQGERDALHRLVIPQLREKARPYGENIQFVDLRWGISTADMDSDEGAGKILEVCLEEIRQCKPYMIVLLGERYGWMPSPALLRGAAQEKDFSLESYEMSVTELEIRYGMYLAQGQLDRCVFCLREDFPEGLLPEDLRDIYIADSPEDRRRMQQLREKICSTPGAKVLRYRLDWDRENNRLTGYEALADRLTEALEEILSGGWETRRQLSWAARQREEDKQVIRMHQAAFVGRERELREISEIIDTHQVVILEGEGGCGKSALMAQLLKRYENTVPSIMYCCGNSNHCMTVMQLMRLMAWRIDAFSGQSYLGHSVKDEKFREYFNWRMEELSGSRLIFFIDAIDQLTPDKGLYESWFIPPRISEKIKLVISTTGAVRVNPIALPRGKQGVSSRILRLTPPEGEDLKQILEARFLAEHKHVSQRVADKILENPCSKNMLGMEIIVRRLLMLGQTDFQKIAELEKSMDGNEAIDTYLIQLAEQIPRGLNGLIVNYMDAVCTFLDDTHFQNMQIPMYFIALLQHGVSAEQLERLESFINTDPAFKSVPQDHPYRHFWNPILFARMKRYLGSLVAQRTDGRVDYTHRLIREALRSRPGVDVFASTLRHWLFYEPQEDLTRLENILVLGRLYEDSELRFNADYECVPAYIKSFFQEPISTAGNLEEDEDPKKAEAGKFQMETLQRSILSDLGGDNGWKHLDTYCRMLDSIIKDGVSANYYMVWFFGVRLCKALEEQGEREKAMALQILCRLLVSLYEQKEAYDAGKEEYADNWSPAKKRRVLLYYTRAMRLLADLWHSKKLGIVKLGKSYGIDEDGHFQRGLALAEECIRQEPETAIQYIRKAQLFCDYAALAKDFRWGKKNNKQTDLIRQTMDCVEKALTYAEKLDEKTKISRRSLCIYVISRCVKVMSDVYATQIFGSKAVLEKAEEYFQRGWDLAKDSEYGDKMKTEDVAQLLIAWERCSNQKEWAYLRKQEKFGQQAVDRLFDYYYGIRGRNIDLSPEARDALATIAASVSSLLLKGYLPESMKKKNVDRGSVLRYLIEKEGSYIQAQARTDFASRWRWAQLMCAEVLYNYNRYPQQCIETGERVIPLLEELLAARDKNIYLDVRESDIKSKKEFIEKLLRETREKNPQLAKP